jgi:hypothetical protein
MYQYFDRRSLPLRVQLRQTFADNASAPRSIFLQNAFSILEKEHNLKAPYQESTVGAEEPPPHLICLTGYALRRRVAF